MSAPRIITVVGARPQFVKAAAISRAIAARNDISEFLVHTGQHYDSKLSRTFFEELQIPEPEINLGIHGQRHGEVTGRMLKALERVMMAEQPDLVLVAGDTTSTLAGALAAAKLHIPVAHLEAGLRSFNRRMPEEINRVLTDHVSTLLLCPTETAVDNLRSEGLVAGVHNVGDVMYDAARFAAVTSKRSDIIDRLGIASRPYAVLTLHRAENTESPDVLGEIIEYLKERARDHLIVFPVHPRTRIRISEWGLDIGRIIACDPVGYFDMQRLLQSAITVFTDSGGLQKEAYFHRVPCVTLRSETEWVETVSAGWNRLWTSPDYTPRRDIAAYGDGNAAQKAVDIIVNYLQCRGKAGSKPSS